MVISLNDFDWADEPGMMAEWWFGPRPFFVRSSAYDILVRELRGYLMREIRSRSFLISAHRGVGKTSLVLRAVEDLTRIVLQSGAYGPGSGNTGPVGRRPSLVRPLLVKLHASALVTTPKLDDWVAPQRAAAKPSVETALQQITIALYRALAGEIAEAFMLHARAITAQGTTQRDLLELAAQLTLDLDLAPDLAALREYWRRLGRLKLGVLWPSPISQQMVASGMADRGMHEIVALATANQAFQVCAGRVEATQSSKGSAERTAKMEAVARIDGRDVANKLFALTAGALVGGAVLSSAGGGAAAAAGLGTALLGTLAFGWSSDRRQRSERSTDYTFIMDRSLQTLDRDLPVVIERIREAGLAPVFLIDELDKLEQPGASIEAITSRLKSLTTDYGFFCFLTDRAYFEEIEEKLRANAYPSEHTLFSHRLLLLYRPAELARYVRELWTIDPRQSNEAVAAWVLTCVILHGARLNAADVRRELARLCNENGRLNADPAEILNSGEYLVPMAVQLAIEHGLDHPDIRRRIETDDAFAQLAIDVLYMISRAWKEGESEVVVNEAAVKSYLVDRRCRDGDKEAAEAALEGSVSAADITTLTARALQLARLLTAFPGVYSAISTTERGVPLPSSPSLTPFASTAASEGDKLLALAPLLISIPGVPNGLLTDTAAPADSDRFRFMFDRYAVPYADWEMTLTVVQQGVSLLDGLRDFLSGHGMTIGMLVAAGVLPSNLDAAALEQSAMRLRAIRDRAAVQLAPPADINRLTGAASAVEESRYAIIRIVAILIRAGGVGPRAVQTLAAIDRMLGIAPLVAMFSGNVARSAVPLQSLKSPNSGLVERLVRAPHSKDAPFPWRDKTVADVEQLRDPTADMPPGAAPLNVWERRVARWLLGRQRPVDPPIYESDIMEAATGKFPASDLRPDFDSMTITEWSRFTMMAFGCRGIDEQAWMFVAGLRALGFGQQVLQAAGGGRFAAVDPPPDQPGLWQVFAPAAELVGPPNPDGIPMFFVPKAEETAYIPVEAWLTENGALAGKTRKDI
jgi:hypothetical protein